MQRRTDGVADHAGRRVGDAGEAIEDLRPCESGESVHDLLRHGVIVKAREAVAGLGVSDALAVELAREPFATVDADLGRALISYAPDFQNTLDLRHPDKTQGMHFGASMLAYDYTGDGIVDVLVGSPTYDAPGQLWQLGRIDVFDGATGFLGPSCCVLTPANPHPFSLWGWQLLAAD